MKDGRITAVVRIPVTAQNPQPQMASKACGSVMSSRFMSLLKRFLSNTRT